MKKKKTTRGRGRAPSIATMRKLLANGGCAAAVLEHLRKSCIVHVGHDGVARRGEAAN